MELASLEALVAVLLNSLLTEAMEDSATFDALEPDKEATEIAESIMLDA